MQLGRHVRVHGSKLDKLRGLAAAGAAARPPSSLRTAPQMSAATAAGGPGSGGRRGGGSSAGGRGSSGGGGSGAPARGDVLELTCTDLAFGGEGICRLPDGFVVFVDRALPGERLTARVVQSKKSFAKAAKLQTLHPHDAATEPACQHFGPCNGCSLQALQYPAQLAAKQRQVADLLRRTAGVADVDAVLRPIVGCQPGGGAAASQPYGYRNKMEFSFSAEAWQPQQPQQAAGGASNGNRSSSISGSNGSSSSFALGLHKPGSSTAVLPISRCHLQPDGANQLLQRVLLLCQQAGLQPHDPVSGSGLLQHVVIRRGTPSSRSAGSSSSSSSSGEADSSSSSSSGSTGSAPAAGEEYLLNFVTASDGRKALAPLARALMQQQQQPAVGQPDESAAAAAAAAPAVVGVVNSVSQRGRPTGERRLAAEHVLEGRSWLTEQLCGLEFEVSATSFFQTNSQQAEVLYRLVAQAAELRPTDVLLDLYCGTGSIGLTLAAACRAVHGVEISAASVRDAGRNAARNGITNASFLQGDLGKLQLEGRLPAPDVVVVDPARPGLAPAVIAYLRACGARRIIYVSCNASTQARDIKLLCGGGGDGDRRDSSSQGGSEAGGEGGSSGSGSSGSPAAEGLRYRLASVQACDLYPHTWHVETVAVLDALPA